MDDEDTFKINFSCGMERNRAQSFRTVDNTSGEGDSFKKRSKGVGSRQFRVQFKKRQASLWRLLKWSKGKEH